MREPAGGHLRAAGVAAAPRRGVLMATLFAAQVCGSTGHSISLAVGSIMAASITGTNTSSGLPIAIGALGTALASWPLARLMAGRGRRPGLALGYALGVVGAVLGGVGVLVHSFLLFLVGIALWFRPMRPSELHGISLSVEIVLGLGVLAAGVAFRSGPGVPECTGAAASFYCFRSRA